MPDRPRVVIITGGSRGIGRSIALRFAREKPILVLVHYDPEDTWAEETRSLLSDFGVSPEVHRLDVSSLGAVSAFFEELAQRHERFDVLVNNAGITRDSLFIRMHEEAWDSVLSVNLKSVFNCTQGVIRQMLRQREGCICTISSVVGQIGNIGQTNYAASKAGIMGFTKSLAKETATRGIRVNAVAPGFIETDMTATIPEKVRLSFQQQIPLGRMGTPEEVAEAVYWLCSEASSYITGQIIHVNGGLFM